MYHRLSIFCVTVSLLVSLLSGRTVAHAQSTTLSVNPPVVEILLAPGKKVTQTFTFTYQGAGLTLTPEIHLAKPTDEQGHVTIDPAPLNTNNLPLTITSSLPLNTAHPLTSQNLPITLTLEASNIDTTADVYLALVLKTSPSDVMQTASITSPAISALLLVTISPNDGLPINLEIKNFLTPWIHDSWSPFTLTPSIENHTSTMMRPTGTYEVFAPSGKSVLKIPLYPNLVLGNGSRNLLGSANPQGYPNNPNQTLGVTLDPIPLTWSPTWYDIGPYRLHLTIISEGGTKLTEVEKTVWVFPLRIGSLVCLACVLIYIVIFRTHIRKQPIDTTPKD